MAISSAGIGSGLDINGLVAGLISSERQKFFLKDLRQANFKERISQYGVIKSDFSNLITLGSKLRGLANNGISAPVNQTISNPGIVNPNIAENILGTFNIDITALATNFVIKDNVGAGNPTFGVNGKNFAIDNSNPAVATASAAQDSPNDYNIQVNTIAQGQINVINGVAATNGAAGGQGTVNTFRIDFGDGTGTNFNVAQGTYTTAAYVNAFNAAAAGRVTASYDSANQRLTYTQNSTGTNNSFTVTNNSRMTNGIGVQTGAFNGANIFQTNAGNTTRTASNSTGNVNGTAFTSQTNNGITVNAAGAGQITFNTLTAGSTVIQQRAGTSNTFRVDFGDGSPSVNFSLASGQFNVNDFVSAFNTAAAGKFTATYDSVTGDITYTGLENGANKTVSVTNTSTQTTNGVTSPFTPSDPFNTSNAITVQNGSDLLGSINGVAFSSQSNSARDIGQPGFNFEALQVGQTTITRTKNEQTPEQIAENNKKIKESLKEFVTAYNKLVSSLKANQERGKTLNVEQAPGRIEKSIRDILNAGADGKAITDFGLSISKEGVMSFDESKFDAQIASDAGAASRFFGDDIVAGVTQKGLLTNLVDFSKSVTGAEGIITLRNNSLNAALKRIDTDRTNFERRLSKLQDRYFKQFSALDSTLSSLQSSSNLLQQRLAQLSF